MSLYFWVKDQQAIKVQRYTGYRLRRAFNTKLRSRNVGSGQLMNKGWMRLKPYLGGLFWTSVKIQK